MPSSNWRGLAFLFFLIIIGIFVWTIRKDSAILCQNLGGEYDKKFRECSLITAKECVEIGGKYIECGSSCRHIKGEICEEKCVSYCQL